MSKTNMPNVFDKEKYGFHYESMQLCLRLGLKMHHIFEFSRS